MNFTLPDFSVALPEIFMLGMSMIVLMVDVFTEKRYREATFVMVQLTLVATIIIAWPQFREYTKPLETFSGHYVVDKLAILSKLFIYLFSIFAFAYARAFINEGRIASGDYYSLGLFGVLGMSIMCSGMSFLTIYLGLELLSLSLYAMVAMNKSVPVSAEAAMKYFILGALASGILLYGISLLYGLTGSIMVHGVEDVLSQNHGVMAIVALIFILAGLLFKFGAIPFHMWVPDVYQGASTPTTNLIASAPKIAAFAITMRILAHSFSSLHVNWEHMLIVVAILSMCFGNLLAIAQTNIKRMLAYSSIAHIGYTMLGLIAGHYSDKGYSAAMFYIVTYVLVSAGGFAIITIMSHDNIEFDQLEDYRGLNARNPWLAFMMLLLLFSMAGVPPTVGFIAKLGLLEALVDAHYVWLAVLALVFAIIGAFYYLRVVKYMYFEEPAEALANVPVPLTKDMFVAITLNGGAVLVLGLLPSTLINLCRITAVG